MAYDYKGAYEWELNDWDRHRSAVTTPIGIATIIGGILGYSAQKFETGSSWDTWAFYVLGALSILCLAVAIYQLVRFIHGHVYARIPRPDHLLTYELEVIGWHERNGLDVALARAKIDANLTRAYAEAASKNVLINARRSEFLYRANRALVCASVLTFLLLPVVALNSLKAAPKPVPVHIVNMPSGGKVMSIQSDPPKDPGADVPDTSPPPAPEGSARPLPTTLYDPEPQFPENWTIREGIIPYDKKGDEWT